MFITCQRLKNCRYTINAIRLNFFSLKKKNIKVSICEVLVDMKKKKKKIFAFKA